MKRKNWRHWCAGVVGVMCCGAARGQAVFSQGHFEEVVSSSQTFSTQHGELTIKPSSMPHKDDGGTGVLYSYEMVVKPSGDRWQREFPLRPIEVIIAEDGSVFGWAYNADFQGRLVTAADGRKANGSIVVFCIVGGEFKWKSEFPRSSERFEFNAPLCAIPHVAGFASQLDQHRLTIYLASTEALSDQISVQNIDSRNGTVLERTRLIDPRIDAGDGVWSCRQVLRVPGTPYDFIYFAGTTSQETGRDAGNVPRFEFIHGAAFVIHDPLGSILWSRICPRLYTQHASPAELKGMDMNGQFMPLPLLEGSAILIPIGNERKCRVVVSKSPDGHDIVQTGNDLKCD